MKINLTKIIALVIILILSGNLYAQSVSDIGKLMVKNDSTTQKFIYEATTKSGNILLGEITKVTADSIQFSTNELGVINLGLNQIKSINIYDSVRKEGERYMVGANHYLVAPISPYGLEKGEVNLQNSEIFLLSAWYGISKYFTIGGGFSVLPTIELSDQLFYLIPKFNYPITPLLNVSVQYTQLFLSETGNNSLLSFSTAFGKIDKHISFGYTTPLFADGDEVAFDAALLSIGGTYRLGNKFALLLDINLPTQDADVGIYGFGTRYIGNSSSFDFGFITNSEIEGVPLPWFNYTLRLN
ncbi:MAG: hypothetical protein ABJH98_12435 [Reichenbachiella sp.]|uniref:hypothetical protein n=1 Tax=Reichenbachiella sp. TaxID=2184521 RepID=UPI0032979D1E